MEKKIREGNEMESEKKEEKGWIAKGKIGQTGKSIYFFFYVAKGKGNLTVCIWPSMVD